MKQKYNGVRFIVAALVLTLGILPAFAAPGKVDAQGGLRLRAGASTSANILYLLPNGSEVDVLGNAGNGWYKVSFKDKTGFVHGDYLIIDEADKPALDILREPTRGRVFDGPLNVRTGPSTSYSRVKLLPIGTIVNIEDEIDGWYKISDGYISADFVNLLMPIDPTATASPIGQEIAYNAQSLLGCRYVYGGASPSSGFDCSGFTKYVLGLSGITIQRTASSQMDNGTAVEYADLLPGDLVFFYKPGSGAKRASHVGIYIGDNQFVHASEPITGVITDRLDSDYYSRQFVGARRCG